MKRLINIISAMTIFMTSLICCQANPTDDIRSLILSQKEDGYGKVMKDSIANIIMDAKQVTCHLLSQNPLDSLREDTVRNLPKGAETILQYLFFNKSNFTGNKTVYGQFTPWARYTFQAKKKRTVHLELDFGLSKWRLLNHDMKEICMQDMKECNGQMLHLVSLLFPKDKTLNMLINNLNLKDNEKSSNPIQLPADNSNK